MTFKVLLEADKCQGYANCLIEAPEIWDFDNENDRALLKIESPGDDLLAKAEASARCCPAQAIRIEGISS
jgi:ferredoxin